MTQIQDQLGELWIPESDEEIAYVMAELVSDEPEELLPTDDALGLGFERCPRCHSTSGQWRGYRMPTTHGVVHRRRCNNCGKWHQVREA